MRPTNEAPGSPVRSSSTHGVVVVNKPEGPTSHDVVAQARRYFGTRRVGHAGTLDPMASGVLLVLVGEATKLSSSLTLEQKSYEATITFGTSTDSDDAQGTPLETRTLSADWLDARRLAEALATECARTEQIPPRVTAIKQDGIAAHKRHRMGLEVTVEPRSVRVFELSCLERLPFSVRLTMTVSKGYYVRSLARDLGVRLGVPSHLSALIRTRSGEFRLEEAVAWPPTQPPNVLSVDEVAARILPRIILTEEGVARARVGKLVSVEHYRTLEGATPTCVLPATPTGWFSEQGKLIAIGQFEHDGVGRVSRGFCLDEPDGDNATRIF